MVVSASGLPSGATLATAKKIAAAKAAAVKKPRVKSNHPSTADMVDGAIRSLKERGGSSFQAIKKYIAATYVVDAEKLAPFIKKYLKSGVVAKKLVQVKGKGASGSFKLSTSKIESKTGAKVKRPAAAKKVVAKKVSVSPAKKTADAKPKKTVVKKTLKKPASPKKTIKTIAAKSPKPKARNAPKLVKKPIKPTIKKTISKVKKSPMKKSAVKK